MFAGENKAHPNHEAHQYPTRLSRPWAILQELVLRNSQPTGALKPKCIALFYQMFDSAALLEQFPFSLYQPEKDHRFQ